MHVLNNVWLYNFLRDWEKKSLTQSLLHWSTGRIQLLVYMSVLPFFVLSVFSVSSITFEGVKIIEICKRF